MRVRAYVVRVWGETPFRRTSIWTLDRPRPLSHGGPDGGGKAKEGSARRPGRAVLHQTRPVIPGESILTPPHTLSLSLLLPHQPANRPSDQPTSSSRRYPYLPFAFATAHSRGRDNRVAEPSFFMPWGIFSSSPFGTAARLVAVSTAHVIHITLANARLLRAEMELSVDVGAALAPSRWCAVGGFKTPVRQQRRPARRYSGMYLHTHRTRVLTPDGLGTHDVHSTLRDTNALSGPPAGRGLPQRPKIRFRSISWTEHVC